WLYCGCCSLHTPSGYVDVVPSCTHPGRKKLCFGMKNDVDRKKTNNTMSVRINCVGDNMLGRSFNSLFATAEALHRPVNVWGDTLPYLHDGTLSIGNLETTITDSQKSIWRNKTFNF